MSPPASAVVQPMWLLCGAAWTRCRHCDGCCCIGNSSLVVVVGDGGDDVGSKWTVEKKEEINGAIMGSVVDVGGVARSPTRASTFGLETLSHRNITSLLQHEIQWASHIMINLLLWKFSTETSPVIITLCLVPTYCKSSKVFLYLGDLTLLLVKSRCRQSC